MYLDVSTVYLVDEVEFMLRCVFGVRFMVDSGVVGCCWIELPKGKYKLREEKSAGETDSREPGKVTAAPARGG